MKAAITLLILGLLFIHGEALRCLRRPCLTEGNCDSSAKTCAKNQDQCFKLGEGGYLLAKKGWGCASKRTCGLLQKFNPSALCCSTDLCNMWSGDPEEMWLDGGGAHHTNDVINHSISCLIYKSHPISINVILSDHHLHNKNHIQWYIRVALIVS